MCRCEPSVIDGYQYNQFIGEMFSQCVYNPTQYVSFLLGMGNIGFWMFAQFPQLVQSCVEGKVDALSPLFIIQWLVGDLCNLIGCILTKQLPTQLYTAIYFCFMDVLMLTQYIFYQCGPKLLRNQLGNEDEDEESEVYTEEITESSIYSDIRFPSDSMNERAPMIRKTKKRKKRKRTGTNTDTSINSASSSLNQHDFKGGSPPETPYGESEHVLQTHYQSNVKTYYMHVGVILLPLIIIYAMPYFVSANKLETRFSRQLNNIRICDASSPIEAWEHWVGIVSAWISGILYFSARIPQIWKNFKRKSVEGLALPMFVCAVLGNVCYGLSILILPIENWGIWMLETFPYVLGSICTLSMSSIIIFQFFIYGALPSFKMFIKRKFSEEVNEDQDTFMDIDRRAV
mmetsp:Transcript_2211/g.3201  ORF Transcript_2211/g.3201 Transcript_2211/m.3201 type:complete len:401 (+) Transcript_2211:139-1341(+)